MARVTSSNNGEVLIRIGDGANGRIGDDANGRIGDEANVRKEDGANDRLVPAYSNGTVNSAVEVDSKEDRHARNEAYRHSSPSNYLKKDAQEYLQKTGEANNKSNTIHANHVIYTKVSSAIVAKSTSNTSSQAFTTRNITSSKVSQSVFIPVNNDTDSNNNGVVNEDLVDDEARKLMGLSNQMEHIYENGPLPEKYACFHCRKTVYTKEKIGPVRDVLYHQQCFRCSVCNFQLTLSNFCQNPRDPEDRRMYCKSHQPLPDTARLDIRDTSFKGVINKPLMGTHNSNIRGGPDAAHRSVPADSINIRGPLGAPKLEVYNSTVRPVPALAAVPQRGPPYDPDAYKNRQLSTGVTLHSPPYRPDGTGSTEDSLFSYLLH